MEGTKSEKNYYLQKLFVCISERSLKCMLLRNHSFAIIYSYLYVPICSDFYGLSKKKHQSSLLTGITPPPPVCEHFRYVYYVLFQCLQWGRGTAKYIFLRYSYKNMQNVTQKNVNVSKLLPIFLPKIYL